VVGFTIGSRGEVRGKMKPVTREIIIIIIIIIIIYRPSNNIVYNSVPQLSVWLCGKLIPVGETFTANFRVLLDAATSSHVEVDRRFRGVYCLHLQGE
jgi:hypothetical protein